jgi:hypothetical protein
MARVTRAYDELTRRLGYSAYGIHGSDAGAVIGRELAVLDPEGFLFQTIRSLAERDNAGVRHWSEFPRGGHYAALQVPEDVVADLRVFFA